MSMAYQHILDYVAANRWAVDFKYFETGLDILHRHLSGEKPSAEEIQQVTAAKNAKGSNDRQYAVRNGTAIIPVSGVIAKYMRMVNGSSQPRGTSIEWLTNQLRHAVTSEDVKRIFLHIESPGGSIEGLADFADEVYNASFIKPVIAFCDDLCCSAAYWIGSQANAMYANQTAWVGSIGVYMVMVDSSRRAENEGFKVHLIRSGANKGVGVSGTPITNENLNVLQTTVDDDYDMFLKAILRGRSSKGLTEDSLRSAADGRHYSASRSIELKLIDGIMPLENAMKQTPKTRVDSKRAAGPSADNDKNNNNRTKSGEITMPENEETQNPAVDVKAIQTEAAKKATDEQSKRLADLEAAFPDNLKFALEQFRAGASVEQAKAAYCDVLARENEKLAAENAELKTKAAGSKPKTPGVPPITAGSEGSDGEGEDFLALAEAMAEDKNISISAAQKKIAKEKPEVFAAYKAALRKSRAVG